jgi:hypothetical protein
MADLAPNMGIRRHQHIARALGVEPEGIEPVYIRIAGAALSR